MDAGEMGNARIQVRVGIGNLEHNKVAVLDTADILYDSRDLIPCLYEGQACRVHMHMQHRLGPVLFVCLSVNSVLAGD